jgi:hypothetical protein
VRAGPAICGDSPVFRSSLVHYLSNIPIHRVGVKASGQVTVFAEITENTENTRKAITGILDPSQDGYHDTGPMSHRCS